ncbi:hypothetical protein BU16DRAFT_560219 [Lophium mytilinum]|uniref:Uncharacterized protein n=1 Tax=Lophium mytilinum TaxID=390894 RepID=A0A6A6QWT8_9PEZI|nr:hypothetical protein BU16DRAFT_560219 [Lophium mytilinum]
MAGVVTLLRAKIAGSRLRNFEPSMDSGFVKRSASGKDWLCFDVAVAIRLGGAGDWGGQAKVVMSSAYTCASTMSTHSGLSTAKAISKMSGCDGDALRKRRPYPARLNRSATEGIAMRFDALFADCRYRSGLENGWRRCDEGAVGPGIAARKETTISLAPTDLDDEECKRSLIQFRSDLCCGRVTLTVVLSFAVLRSPPQRWYRDRRIDRYKACPVRLNNSRGTRRLAMLEVETSWLQVTFAAVLSRTRSTNPAPAASACWRDGLDRGVEPPEEIRKPWRQRHPRAGGVMKQKLGPISLGDVKRGERLTISKYEDEDVDVYRLAKVRESMLQDVVGVVG